jgi:hypothetical protein
MPTYAPVWAVRAKTGSGLRMIDSKAFQPCFAVLVAQDFAL